MLFALGVVLFAVGIGVSIALHEAGHMWTAKALGMKVRRYYIGFGPKIFSFRRGETEYGLKAIPAGGFCDIAGMTAIDELAPDEVERAMYRQKTWKRIVVMVGGIAMNFVLGIVLIYALVLGWGTPDRVTPTTTVQGVGCVGTTQTPDGEIADCSGDGPAAAAGLREGDIITAVDGTPTEVWSDAVLAIQASTGSVELTVDRNGASQTITVPVTQVQRYVVDPDTGARESTTVGAVGVTGGPPPNITYNPIEAVPETFAFTGDIFVQTGKALVQLPTKVQALWESIFGGERGLDTPMSVVGASVIGGQAAETENWATFIGLLASLNFFLGAFNLVPLLPLDGGHIAVTIYERIRNIFRNRRGLPDGAPVDYMKLMPVTYVVIVVFIGFSLLTLTADIVNPIQLF
ncbi:MULTISPECIES: M50 family metallopeptidase [Rhodococcus]|jgi:membrane-associated protease RseP (regulator of RpoE activity)|uniref:Zinc metalloprotease Rip1 n=1 Tax=Rhodococcus cerastii TaxID=908616 RepID=A0ABU4CWX5_9NOCA|nr:MULTISPECIES: M50 family metallopeptidase [Rhodococcus]KAA0926719.1 site-2 protease family protein [Rhodococcus sp. ANT_H53B]KZF05401.1 zinc metalloprotease [Rhodococcus sp. EPR-147]KZF06277.1 zinc metalloprotease [Rhodococcus sp. EPR-279]MDI6629352.1 M50 family metallopeptidase [Rhodococcus sp. (in: high G+C Gram-positive bacteria)]MDI9924945.1 M50 family metallopeptidase [Rhodococcus sp. IEGM 1341]